MIKIINILTIFIFITSCNKTLYYGEGVAVYEDINPKHNSYDSVRVCYKNDPTKFYGIYARGLDYASMPHTEFGGACGVKIRDNLITIDGYFPSIPIDKNL